MSIRSKAVTTAALMIVAATSASALVITGTFFLSESVPVTATMPGSSYMGHYTTVDFDNSVSMAGDIVLLSDISIPDLFGGFSFTDFDSTPLAVLGDPGSVIALSGTASTFQFNPFQFATLSLGIPYGNPADATFGAALVNNQGFQLIHGHQTVPEPSMFALLGGGLLALGSVGLRRRRKLI